MLTRTIPVLLAIAALAAGCVTPPAAEVDANATDLASESMAMPETEPFEGSITLSVATPARTINNGGAFSTVIEVEDNTTGYILELEWDAASPASETLSMWVRPAGAGSVGVPPDPSLVTGTAPPLGKVDGTSPLRLALPADAFPEAGEYDVVIRASAQPLGVAVNQPFTVHVTVFEDMPFDDAYTALGEHGHA